MKKFIATSFFILITTSASADNVINTHTNSWKNVPITVNEKQHTYKVNEGYLLPEGNYYYSYSGFRCLKYKVNNAGTDPVVYNDLKSKSHSIYCYPEK